MVEEVMAKLEKVYNQAELLIDVDVQNLSKIQAIYLT
jgi:hypothetical protein